MLLLRPLTDVPFRLSSLCVHVHAFIFPFIIPPPFVMAMPIGGLPIGSIPLPAIPFIMLLPFIWLG